MKNSLLLPVAVASTLALLAGTACADDANDAKSIAERGRVAQEEVQASAAQIQQQIALINQELRGNGIDEAQIKDIDATLKNLGSLSTKDMAGVLSTLQGVGTADSEKARQDGLVTAYKGQQGILTKMSSLIASMQVKETTDQLRLQIQNMLIRQISNLRLSADLQKLGANLGDRDKGRLDVAAANQAALQSNFATILAGVNRLATQLSTDDGAAFKQKLQGIKGDDVRTAAASAADATKAANWASALPAQMKFRDGLLAFLDLVNSGDPAAALDQAQREVARLVESEKTLPADVGESRSEAQAGVQDMASLAALRLPGVSADAAQKVAAAERSMDKARLASDKKESGAAADAALALLQQSLDLLKNQATALAKAQAATPQQRLDQLQQLSSQLAQAQQQEAQAAKDPAAAKDLAAKLAKMQQDAAPVSPQAAQAIGQAAAETAPPDPSQNPAQANQSQNNADAAQQLAQAQQAVQQQIAQAQTAAQQGQQLAQMQQAVDQAQQQTSQAQQQMQNAQGLPNAVNQLLQAEKGLEAAQQQQGQALPADAQQAMQQAQQALQQATQQAAQGQQQAAQAAAQQAQQAMQQAQGAMQQAAQQLAQAPGGQPPAPSMASQTTQDDTGQTLTGLLQGGQGGNTTDGSALVVGKIKPQDRQAIASLKGEKAPAEYAPLVSQYYKNLADGTGR